MCSVCREVMRGEEKREREEREGEKERERESCGEWLATVGQQ